MPGVGDVSGNFGRILGNFATILGTAIGVIPQWLWVVIMAVIFIAMIRRKHG